MYGRTERCDDIDSAGHKSLFYVVTFVKMPLFERGHNMIRSNSVLRQCPIDGIDGLDY